MPTGFWNNRVDFTVRSYSYIANKDATICNADQILAFWILCCVCDDGINSHCIWNEACIMQSHGNRVTIIHESSNTSATDQWQGYFAGSCVGFCNFKSLVYDHKVSYIYVLDYIYGYMISNCPMLELEMSPQNEKAGMCHARYWSNGRKTVSFWIKQKKVYFSGG